MPNPPAAPNFAAAATQQGQENLTAAQRQARLNNPNFHGIGGTQTVTYGADGTPTVTQSLSPEQQALYGQWTANQGAAGAAAGNALGSGNFGGALDLSGAPAMPGDYGSVRQRVIDAMMGRADQRFGQQEDQINSDLIARGIRPGTEAYAREMQRLDQSRNDAYSQAEIAGGNAADQAFRADLARRGQGVNEAVLGRQIPFSELGGLFNLSRFDMPNLPGYSGNTQVAPAPVYGAATAQSNYDVDLWNAEQQQRNSQLNGLLGLGQGILNLPSSSVGGSLISGLGSGVGNWLSGLFD